MTRTRSSICLTLALLLLAGCRGASVVPEGWSAQPDEMTPSTKWQREAQIERDRAPRVQVFIHFNRTHSSHAAVRVTSPDRPAVFWDPGGAYGLYKPSYGRNNDVILDAPPDLPTWWEYRKRWLKEPFLLVFEWDLDTPQATRMQDALLDGAAHGRSAQEFRTLRTPGFCVIGISDFLRTYGPPRISPKLRSNFWPNTLAQQLWKQAPDRVLRYEGEIDSPPVVWLPAREAGDGLASEPRDDTPAKHNDAAVRRPATDASPGS